MGGADFPLFMQNSWLANRLQSLVIGKFPRPSGTLDRYEVSEPVKALRVKKATVRGRYRRFSPFCTRSKSGCLCRGQVLIDPTVATSAIRCGRNLVTNRGPGVR